jgi:phage terminase small subunit
MELTNPQHEAFAQHVASGLSLTEAAKRSGYSETAAHNSGSRVAQKPLVAKRINELRTSRAGVPSVGFRSPAGRVSSLEDRWARMRRIIIERADDPEMEAVPGGKTGLLVKQMKQIGTGDKAQVITSFVLDRELLSELRAHEQQAAEELGQWSTRKESYTRSDSFLFQAMTTEQLKGELEKQLRTIPEPERRKLLAGGVIDAERVESDTENESTR